MQQLIGLLCGTLLRSSSWFGCYSSNAALPATGQLRYLELSLISLLLAYKYLCVQAIGGIVRLFHYFAAYYESADLFETGWRNQCELAS